MASAGSWEASCNSVPLKFAAWVGTKERAASCAGAQCSSEGAPERQRVPECPAMTMRKQSALGIRSDVQRRVGSPPSTSDHGMKGLSFWAQYLTPWATSLLLIRLGPRSCSARFPFPGSMESTSGFPVGALLPASPCFPSEHLCRGQKGPGVPLRCSVAVRSWPYRKGHLCTSETH